MFYADLMHSHFEQFENCLSGRRSVDRPACALFAFYLARSPPSFLRLSFTYFRRNVVTNFANSAFVLLVHNYASILPYIRCMYTCVCVYLLSTAVDRHGDTSINCFFSFYFSNKFRTYILRCIFNVHAVNVYD